MPSFFRQAMSIHITQNPSTALGDRLSHRSLVSHMLIPSEVQQVVSSMYSFKRDFLCTSTKHATHARPSNL